MVPFATFLCDRLWLLSYQFVCVWQGGRLSLASYCRVGVMRLLGEPLGPRRLIHQFVLSLVSEAIVRSVAALFLVGFRVSICGLVVLIL